MVSSPRASGLDGTQGLDRRLLHLWPPDPEQGPSPGWKPTAAPGPLPGHASVLGACPPDGGPQGGWPGATPAVPPATAQATHSEPEPWAWALPARTFMATPLRCSRPGSRCSVLAGMAPSGARTPSLEAREDGREDAGLCSRSANFSRSRDFSIFSVSGGG